jgi:hypothetical protein
MKSFARSGGDCLSEGWLNHVHPKARQRVQARFANALTGHEIGWICEYPLQR